MKTQRVARAIDRDLDGARYLSDPALLSRYLRAKLRVPQERAAAVARAILADRRGAGRYRGTCRLSALLEEQLGGAAPAGPADLRPSWHRAALPEETPRVRRGEIQWRADL
jgi:hypothetical protein